MRANLVVRVTPADVGRRVSLRSRLIEPGPGPTTTDTVGRLLAWEDGQLSVQRRDGSVANVASSDLLAGKVIPEPPTRRRTG